MSIRPATWTPWLVSGDRQVMPELHSDDYHQRFIEMANAYGLDAWLIRRIEDKHRLKEWVILCITIAETSWWHRWAGKNNIWNVGNNDRWDRVEFNSLEDSLNAIGQTLNNKYLWWKQTLGCLSLAGNCNEENDNGKIYASSTSAWEKNVTSCLTSIYATGIDSSFLFRKWK